MYTLHFEIINIGDTISNQYAIVVYTLHFEIINHPVLHILNFFMKKGYSVSRFYAHPPASQDASIYNFENFLTFHTLLKGITVVAHTLIAYILINIWQSTAVGWNQVVYTLYSEIINFKN